MFRHFIRSNRGRFEDIDKIRPEEVQAALARAKNSKKLDQHGMCLAVLALVFDLAPLFTCILLDHYSWDYMAMEDNEKVAGRVYGKESNMPVPTECRAILPMNTLHSVCDFIFSARMSRVIADKFQVPPDFFVGAQKGTQTNDIAWSSQIVIEVT